MTAFTSKVGRYLIDLSPRWLLIQSFDLLSWQWEGVVNGLLFTSGATKWVLLAAEVASITGILSAYKDEACMTEGFADCKSEVAPATWAEGSTQMTWSGLARGVAFSKLDAVELLGIRGCSIVANDGENFLAVLLGEEVPESLKDDSES
jgi:hypothetical protein